MEKEKNFDLKLNIVVGMLNQVFIIIINLVTKTLIQRKLGIEYMGIQTVFSNICDLIMFAFNGSGIAVLYSLYRPIEENDTARIQKLYLYYNKIYRYMAGISLFLGIAVAGVVPFVINAEVSAVRVELFYFLYLFSMLIYSRYLVLHFVLIAYQKRYVICLISGALEIVFLLAELLAIIKTGRYELFLGCILIKNTLISGGLSVYLKKKYGKTFREIKKQNLEEAEKKSILVNIKDLTLCQAGNVLINNTDSILISGLINTLTSGCYSNYYFVSAGVLGIAGSFFESIIAKVGSLSVTSSKEEFYNSFWKVSMIAIWINGFSVTCYYLLIQDFVRLWIGQTSILPSTIVFIVTLNLYLEGMKLVTGTYRKSVGIFNNFDKLVLFRGALNLVLSVLLGRIVGLFGILVATTISNLCTEYWYAPYRLYSYFDKPIKYEVIYQIIGAVSTLICIWLTGKSIVYIDGTSWIGFFCKAVLCVIVSNSCYFLFAMIYIKAAKKYEKRGRKV